MTDDDLRSRLHDAAGTFPVRGRPANLSARIAARRRRTTAGYAVLAAVAAAAVLALVPHLRTGPDRAAPAASSTCLTTTWQLTEVTHGTKFTAVPVDFGATLELRPDGRLFADDGVNFTDARYTLTTGGFDVSEAKVTTAGYAGHDPARLAAIAGLAAIAAGDSNGVASPAPVHDQVVSVDMAGLVVRAGTYRLTFASTAALDRRPPSPVPSNSYVTFDIHSSQPAESAFHGPSPSQSGYAPGLPSSIAALYPPCDEPSGNR